MCIIPEIGQSLLQKHEKYVFETDKLKKDLHSKASVCALIPDLLYFPARGTWSSCENDMLIGLISIRHMNIVNVYVIWNKRCKYRIQQSRSFIKTRTSGTGSGKEPNRSVG